MLILCRCPKLVGTEASLCIYSERVGGDVLLPADLGAGGQVQVGAGPPEALAGRQSSIGMACIHNSLIISSLENNFQILI